MKASHEGVSCDAVDGLDSYCRRLHADSQRTPVQHHVHHAPVMTSASHPLMASSSSSSSASMVTSSSLASHWSLDESDSSASNHSRPRGRGRRHLTADAICGLTNGNGGEGGNIRKQMSWNCAGDSGYASRTRVPATIHRQSATDGGVMYSHDNTLVTSSRCNITSQHEGQYVPSFHCTPQQTAEADWLQFFSTPAPKPGVVTPAPGSTVELSTPAPSVGVSTPAPTAARELHFDTTAELTDNSCTKCEVDRKSVMDGVCDVIVDAVEEGMDDVTVMAIDDVTDDGECGDRTSAVSEERGSESVMTSHNTDSRDCDAPPADGVQPTSGSCVWLEEDDVTSEDSSSRSEGLKRKLTCVELLRLRSQLLLSNRLKAS